VKLIPGSAAGAPMRFTRALGVPALIAIGLSAVGASVYFALGIVASYALGLTPIAYLLAGALFVITVMTYVEGNSLHPERGGASTFARYAGNELWSFIAGWVVILDYLIVMAICVFAAAHYLTPFWPGAGVPPGEILVALVVIAFVAWANIRGVSADRLTRVLRAGLLSVGLFAAIVVYGLATLWDPARLVESIDLGSAPTIPGFVFAIVIAAIALIGIESASGLADEIRVGRHELRRVVALSAAIVPAVMIGISLVALMALPVSAGETELGGPFAASPVLGVVSAFDPGWLRAAFTAAVGAVAVAVLVLAANGNMLGLSRLGYSLATNRQIPSAIGRLHPGRATPYVLVTIASLMVFGLVLSSDLEFLAGLFAFGSMLAATIAHVSILVLRFREPGARRAFRVPLSIPAGRGSIPLPALVGALAAAAAWVSVLVLHEGARVAGAAWMAFGLVMYVIYRKSAGKSLAKRFVIPEQSLRDERDVEYGSILVPVFGHPIDDDIVGTAGRLAAEEAEPGEEVTIDSIFVLEIPMSLPIDARIPPERVEQARAALRRAREVGEEYDGVKVETATVRGRTTGRSIVSEARRRGVELIVMAAESVGRTRGGVLLGGQADPRDRAFGEVTRYVVEKAPCRVLLTAAPAGEVGERDAVAPR
jgi:APA family basic amino acid/polyamine antiporter